MIFKKDEHEQLFWFIIMLLICWGVGYLLICFVTWSWSPVKWGDGGRLLAGTMWIASIYAAHLIAEFIMDY